MTIAGGIILIMLGAILTWAVEFSVAGIDIHVIGVILMVGGLAGLLFGIWRLTTVRRTVTPVTPVTPVDDDYVTQRRVYEERHYNE